MTNNSNNILFLALVSKHLVSNNLVSNNLVSNNLVSNNLVSNNLVSKNIVSKKLKIYTKTGDKGKTSLIGGERVAKYNIRIEAYGDVDELIAFIALLREQKIKKIQKQLLLMIEDNLMIVATTLATGAGKIIQPLPAIMKEDIEILEFQIDEMEKVLLPLASFILPGGNKAVAVCHIARTVCRRAERHALKLSAEEKIDQLALVYLNRLSDFLFVLSRKIGMDSGVVDIPWNSHK